MEDVLVTQLLSSTEHHIEYEGMIETARAVREQVDRDDVRRHTGASPFARASFTLVAGQGIVAPAGGGGRTA